MKKHLLVVIYPVLGALALAQAGCAQSAQTSGASQAEAAPEAAPDVKRSNVSPAAQATSGSSADPGSDSGRGADDAARSGETSDTDVRGNPDSATTSDRTTSRTWDGLGSTGGATGTGTSSGTTADDAPAGTSR